MKKNRYSCSNNHHIRYLSPVTWKCSGYRFYLTVVYIRGRIMQLTKKFHKVIIDVFSKQNMDVFTGG